MVPRCITRRERLLLTLAFVAIVSLYVHLRHNMRTATVFIQHPATGNHSQVGADNESPTSDSMWCQERFGERYLTNARNFSGSYCVPGSGSALNCFWSQTTNTHSDVTCFGTRAVFDHEQKIFQIECPLRWMKPEDDARHLPHVPDDFHSYWRHTGPAEIIGDSLTLRGRGPREEPKRTTILVKREGAHNLWHSMMEIMSLTLSLDLLEMSVRDTGAAYLHTNQMGSTQVILADTFEDGPYIDLWRLFARMPVRRLSEIAATEPTSNIIVPFVGASNPMWQADWDELSCKESPLLHSFIRRVLEFHKIPEVEEKGSDKSFPIEDVVVTFVDRKGARELLDQAGHIEALRKSIPHMKLEVVDFAAVSLEEQLKVARRTDVLLGVHGAGLTHSMFLKPGSVVVEILPADLNHKGFRNMAQMLGHRYFRMHAQASAVVKKKSDWHNDPVQVDAERLIATVKGGVQAMYSRNGQDYELF